MKKDTTTIKRILRQTDNTNLHGYFQNEDDFIICNGYSIIKFDMNNIDFIADIDNLNNNTNKYYNYKSFNEHITKNQDARNTNGSQTIEILVEDLKMWKKHGKKGNPFIIATKKGFMGLNPYFLLDLASLTRQDKNKLIKIKVLDKKAPLYIDGNGVKAILCPIVLNKTNFSKDDYLAFLDKLADCYDLEKNTQELKALEKARRNKKIKVSNMPIIVKNGVACKDGYIYSDRNVDFFIYKNADNKTYTLYHLNSMLPCFTDCKSIAAAIELIYDKFGGKSFIDIVIDFMQGNGAQERHDNAGATLATYGFLEDVKHFIDKMIDFKPTPAPTPNNDTTKEETTTPDICAVDMSATDEETPKTATIQDNADIVKADTVKDDTCTATADNMSATATDTANAKDINTDLKTIEIPVILRYSDYEHIRIKKGYYININNYDYIIYQKQTTNEYTIYNLNYMLLYGYDDFKTVSDAINHLNDTADKQNEYYNIHNHYTKQEIYNIYASYNFYNKYELVKQYVEKDIQADHETPKQTDKPQPVKLYGANIPTLERIPTYTQRIVSRFKPLKTQGVYNNRVSNKKVLKKAYNDFVGTVSCYNDKCVVGGKVAAGNTS